MGWFKKTPPKPPEHEHLWEPWQIHQAEIKIYATPESTRPMKRECVQKRQCMTCEFWEFKRVQI